MQRQGESSIRTLSNGLVRFSNAATLVAGFLVLLNAPKLNAQACAIPPAGLLSWWRAEGNTSDAVGTNHGTIVGGVGFGTGEVGQAFYFDGATGGIDVGPWFNLQTF